MTYEDNINFAVTWQDIDGGTSDLTSYLTTNKIISYTFNPWTRTPGATYGIKVKVSIAGQPDEVVDRINYNIIDTPLVAYIEGGNNYNFILLLFY